ncbi:MAG: hypothetical protein AAF514_12290 [Verrucomicrobiota bacterium]
MAMRFLPFFLWFLVLALAVSGCRSAPRENGTVPADEEVPEMLPPTREIEVGKISLVRPASGFVLIESVTKTPIPPGSLLEARSDEGTARLRLGKERQKEFLIADILEGEVRDGSPVFLTFPENRSLPVVSPMVTKPESADGDAE